MPPMAFLRASLTDGLASNTGTALRWPAPKLSIDAAIPSGSQTPTRPYLEIVDATRSVNGEALVCPKLRPKQSANDTGDLRHLLRVRRTKFEGIGRLEQDVRLFYDW